MTCPGSLGERPPPCPRPEGEGSLKRFGPYWRRAAGSTMWPAWIDRAAARAAGPRSSPTARNDPGASRAGRGRFASPRPGPPREPAIGPADPAVVTIVAEPRRDPGELRGVAAQVRGEVGHRHDVRGAGAAVVRERIVFERVRIRAVEAVPGETLHVRLPRNAGVGQLVTQPGRGQPVKAVVADAPGRARRHRQVVRKTWAAHGGVVRRYRVLLGQARDVWLPQGQLGGGVFQHDSE